MNRCRCPYLDRVAINATARLLQGDGYRTATKPLRQLRGPGVNRFRGMNQLAARSFAVGGLHGPIVFLVGPIQPDIGGEGFGVLFEIGHSLIPFLFSCTRYCEESGLCFREGLIVESGNQTASRGFVLETKCIPRSKL